MTFAKEISEKFMQHTTSVKIEECSKMIALIQNKLREQDEKAQKISENVQNLIGYWESCAFWKLQNLLTGLLSMAQKDACLHKNWPTIRNHIASFLQIW